MISIPSFITRAIVTVATAVVIDRVTGQKKPEPRIVYAVPMTPRGIVIPADSRDRSFN